MRTVGASVLPVAEVMIEASREDVGNGMTRRGSEFVILFTLPIDVNDRRRIGLLRGEEV